jgi:hypothetical protein
MGPLVTGRCGFGKWLTAHHRVDGIKDLQTIDIRYTFNGESGPGALALDQADRRVAEEMSSYWVNSRSALASRYFGPSWSGSNRPPLSP